MAKKPDSREGDPSFTTIFVKRIKLRNGRVLTAAEAGLKAFPIKVKVKKQ